LSRYRNAGTTHLLLMPVLSGAITCAADASRPPTRSAIAVLDYEIRSNRSKGAGLSTVRMDSSGASENASPAAMLGGP
jgi:hypothetical protein